MDIGNGCLEINTIFKIFIGPPIKGRKRCIMIKNWIIAIGSNNADFLYKFTGTVEEAKEKLMEIVIKDRVNDAVNFDYGTNDVESLTQVNGCENEFCAYSCFFHIVLTI